MLSELSLICAVIGALVALAASGALIRGLNMRPHLEILGRALDDYRLALEMERSERARLAGELSAVMMERDKLIAQLATGQPAPESH